MHPTHLPVIPQPGTPANILRNAARYLQRNGWTRGEHYFHPKDGNPSTWPLADALGAIGVVVHGNATANPAHPSLPGWTVFTAACDVLDDYLDVADDYRHDVPDAGIGEWNDQPDMTAERVIAALNAAADRWEDLSGGAA